MKQVWRRFSIKTTMVILFMAISLTSIVLMGVISHMNYSHAVKQDFHTVTEEAAKRLNHHIEYYFEQFSKTTKTLQNEDLLQSWFEGSRELTIFEKEEIEAQLRRNIALNYNEVTGVFLRSTDHRVLAMRSYFSLETDFTREPWYAVPFSAQRVLLPTHTITYPSKNGMAVISMITPVYSSTSLTPIGSIILDLSLDEIASIFERSRLGESGLFMMMSQDDTIVYHPNKEWRGLKLSSTPLGAFSAIEEGDVGIQSYEGRKVLVSTSSSKVSGWKVTAIVPFDEMASGLYTARNATLAALIVIALLIVWTVPWVSNLFVAPVLHLKNHLNAVMQGNYRTRAEVHDGSNELMILNRSFNRMVEQLDEQVHLIASLELKEIHARLRQKEAYFLALQNQINPHFLYNSLDIIKSIGYLHNDDLVVSMAGNLADVYRYTAKISDNEVSLKEELAILEKYLEMTQIRYPKLFRSCIQVDPRLYDCLLVKLTVQPLVENAVKYAVEPRGGQAEITVGAYEDQGDLVIEVKDNGDGIPDEVRAQLTRRLNRITLFSSDQDEVRTESLGITNVHTRLVLKYGDQYGLNVQPAPGGGTLVSIRVPLQFTV